MSGGEGDLAGRHALVTGASRGIGAAIARRLASHGARMTLLGRDAAALRAVSGSLPSATGHTVLADVTDADSLRRALASAEAAFGPVDLLVNNAGRAGSAPAQETSDELWETMLATNLTATFRLARAVLPGMLERRYGRIVNVASTAGLKGYAYVAAYCAAKHGVVGLTRSLAQEVAVHGITVNAVCPGYTETDLVRGAVETICARTGRSEEAAVAALVASNPQRRLVQPDEVANAVAWLCLPGAEAVNGQAIAVAGGEL